MDKTTVVTGHFTGGGPSGGWFYYFRAVGWTAAGILLMGLGLVIRHVSEQWCVIFQAAGLGAWVCGYSAKRNERKRATEEFDHLKQRFAACKDADDIERLKQELLDRRR
jgi:hypothetical protein